MLASQSFSLSGEGARHLSPGCQMSLPAGSSRGLGAEGSIRPGGGAWQSGRGSGGKRGGGQGGGVQYPLRQPSAHRLLPPTPRDGTERRWGLSVSAEKGRQRPRQLQSPRAPRRLARRRSPCRPGLGRRGEQQAAGRPLPLPFHRAYLPRPP